MMAQILNGLIVGSMYALIGRIHVVLGAGPAEFRAHECSCSALSRALVMTKRFPGLALPS